MNIDKRYNLVFEGKIAEGKRLEEVKDNLRTLVNSTSEAVDGLFVSGKQTIIKRSLDYGQAVKYKEAFEKSGALCSIVETVINEPPFTFSMAGPRPTTTEAPPIKLSAPRSFSIKLSFRLLFSTAPLLMILTATQLPFNFSQLPKEGAIVLSSFFFIAFALMCFLARKFWQPVLTFSDQELGYSLANPFKPLSVKWSQIHGMTLEERIIGNKPQMTVKLSLDSDCKGAGEVAINVNALQDGEEALTLLKQMIPEKKAREFSNTLLKFKPVSNETMKYRDIEIVHEGIVVTSKFGRKRIVVPWNNIVGISTESFVIAGYGSVTVRYLDAGTTRNLLIRASMCEAYQDCIKLLIANAKEAALDPGIIAMLEYPINSAKADAFAIILLCTGFLLALGGLIILSFYPPTVASTWLYPLLLLPLVLAPLTWTIKLISSRFKGNGVEPFRKILAASLCNIGVLLSIAILFSLSPSSFIWLLADTNALLGRLDVAETYYLKAYVGLAENENFLFTLGQFYSLKKDWDKASQYYIRAYVKDPTNWMPEPLTQIPHSLYMAGKYEEALQWCDRIKSQYSGRAGTVRAIERKREEIKNKMPRPNVE